MKQRFLFFLALCFATFSTGMAQSKQDAVTMVSYEQNSSDIKGTLALKNNTDSTIHNLTFVITYLDMNGTPLDYQEYSHDEEIAPGMTKKVDIPAYEYLRDYSYYKSEASPVEPHRFKIKFEVKEINPIQKNFISDKADSDTLSYNDTSADHLFPWLFNLFVWSSGLWIFAILFGIGITVVMYVLVALMAQKRQRNPVLWILVSLFISPLVVIIILLCLGKSSEYHEDFQ